MKKDNIIKAISDLASKSDITLSEFSMENFLGYRLDTKDLCNFFSLLRNDKELRFTILTDLFGADFPERKKRFEVVYSLLSLKLNQRLLVKIDVEDGETANSVASIFSAACWYEREIYDMFGIYFEKNPDMRRILTDYGFVGHPLRKDFPVTGHVQVKYSESLQRVIYEPVELEHEFRMFDFVSPWQGPDYVLPGDEKATK